MKQMTYDDYELLIRRKVKAAMAYFNTLSSKNERQY
jgi:hypothetical protein